MKKINHDYKCDKCGKVAKYNLQGDGWCLWSIDEAGNFKEIKCWGLGESGNNEFFCEECAYKGDYQFN